MDIPVLQKNAVNQESAQATQSTCCNPSSKKEEGSCCTTETMGKPGCCEPSEKTKGCCG